MSMARLPLADGHVLCGSLGDPAVGWPWERCGRMLPSTRDEWVDIAAALAIGCYGPDDGRTRYEAEKLAWKVMRALDASGGVWNENVAANLPAAWFRADAADGRPTIEHGHGLWFLRTAWRLLKDDLASIPRGERAEVQAMLRMGGTAAHRWSFDAFPDAPPVVAGPNGTLTVTALLACPMGRDKAVAVGCATMVRHVDASSAPIVVTLVGEGDDEVALRAVDGVFFRPVLSPNSWIPIGLDRFAEAAGSGEAWADNPWLPVPTRMVSGQSVADVVRPRSDKDRNADMHETRFVGDAGARADGLIVVDGIVHRVCDAPTVEMGMLVDQATPTGREGLRMGWHLGNLHQFSEQGTVRPTMPRMDWRCRDDRYYTGFWPVISISDMPLARMLAETTLMAAERCGWKERAANLCLTVPVTVHDPDVMPDMARASLQRLSYWGWKQYTSSLARLGDVLVTLDPANGMPDVDAVDTAFDAVMAIVSEPGWKDDRDRTASSLVDALDIVAMQVRGRRAVDDMVAVPTP